MSVTELLAKFRSVPRISLIRVNGLNKAGQQLQVLFSDLGSMQGSRLTLSAFLPLTTFLSVYRPLPK